MNSVSSNPLLFFRTPQALSKQILVLSLANRRWAYFAKEFQKKPLNMTFENEKFQMLDGVSVFEKRAILKTAPLYTKLLIFFVSKKYKERIENLAKGLFELMQSGFQIALDEEQILADQKARMANWKANAQKPVVNSPVQQEELDTPLVMSLFLGNFHNLLSIENLLAKIQLKFTGNKDDRGIYLGKVLETIGLATLKDCRDKGIKDNSTADQYLEKNLKNFKQLILKNHGNVIKEIN